MSEMSDSTADRPDEPPASDPWRNEMLQTLRSVRTRLRVLTVVLIVMAMLLTATLAAVVGELVNYFAGDTLVFGAMAGAGVVVGFFGGWIARRRA